MRLPELSIPGFNRFGPRTTAVLLACCIAGVGSVSAQAEIEPDDGSGQEITAPRCCLGAGGSVQDSDGRCRKRHRAQGMRHGGGEEAKGGGPFNWG